MKIKISFFPVLEKSKPESVLKISGKVVKRSSETENLDLKTGKIEISIMSVEVLSDAKELPLPVFGEQDYPEEIRLKIQIFRSKKRRDAQKYNFKIKSNFFYKI